MRSGLISPEARACHDPRSRRQTACHPDCSAETVSMDSFRCRQAAVPVRSLVERSHDCCPVNSDQRCMRPGQAEARHTAIAAKVRVNGVFMTITYFAKTNRNDWRPARAVVRRLDNLLRKVTKGLMPPGELSARKVTRQKMS